MRLRLGPGPVFVYEWLTTSRRWQPYALRALFVGLILIGMMIVQSDRPAACPRPAGLAPRPGRDRRADVPDVRGDRADAGPAGGAGGDGRCRLPRQGAGHARPHARHRPLERRDRPGQAGGAADPGAGPDRLRGAGHWRLAGLLGGIDPMALVGSFLVAIGCALLGCSLAMALSVYGRKTHEVLMMTYMILIVWVMAPVLAGSGHRAVRTTSPSAGGEPLVLYVVIEWSHPYVLAIAPVLSDPGQVGVETYLGFLAGCLLISAALGAWRRHRCRRVAIRQAGRPPTGAGWRSRGCCRRPRLPGPSMDATRWRGGSGTARGRRCMMRVAWGMYAALGLLWVWLAMAAAEARPAFRPMTAAVMNVFQVTIGLLLAERRAPRPAWPRSGCAAASTSCSRPRCSTRSILLGNGGAVSVARLDVVIGRPRRRSGSLAHGGYWTTYIALIGPGAGLRGGRSPAWAWRWRPG